MTAVHAPRKNQVFKPALIIGRGVHPSPPGKTFRAKLRRKYSRCDARLLPDGCVAAGPKARKSGGGFLIASQRVEKVGNLQFSGVRRGQSLGRPELSECVFVSPG